MKTKILFLSLLTILFSCQKTEIKVLGEQTSIVPIPKTINIDPDKRGLILSNSILFFTSTPEINTLLNVFEKDIESISSMDIKFKETTKIEADLVFEIDNNLEDEEYSIQIGNNIIVNGGSYNALAMAKSSLIQLLKLEKNKLIFPILEIKDKPDSEYRGLLIDLARMWHDVSTLKDIIDLASFYKIKYLQLHLSDDQSFTFPSEKFPKLATTDRPYSKKDFRDLVKYAKDRGIIIIPEMDIPGHSRQMVEIYPEIFGVNNKMLQTNPWKSNVINIGSEKVYDAIDQLIGEIIEVFDTSPYFHIGGDEANLDLYKNVPEINSFMRKNNLGTDVHELFRYFLVRMNKIVKKHNKKMFLWEGFRREGKIEIPRDVVVFAFETMYHLPSHLIEDGFTVVNTSWTPLYLVNGGLKQPRARRAVWSPETIYSWNIWRWEHWWYKTPVYKNPMQLEETSQIIGGQMCSWEQTGEAEIPTLRKRLPVFIERVWNNKEKMPFEDFFTRVEKNDLKLSGIINDKRQDSILLGFDSDDHYEAMWVD
jgi:hexosaminidase